LIFHKYHPEKTLLIECPDIIANPSQSAIFKLSPRVQNLAVSCLKQRHFGLLLIEIKSQTVYILDGFRVNRSQWNDYIMFALKVTDFVTYDATSRRVLAFPRKSSPFAYEKMGRPKDQWSVQMHPNNPNQNDTHSCGPIMCHCTKGLAMDMNEKFPAVWDQTRTDIVDLYAELAKEFNDG
jgi:hypothetical protein